MVGREAEVRAVRTSRPRVSNMDHGPPRVAASMEGLPEEARPDHRGVHGGAPGGERDRTTELGRGVHGGAPRRVRDRTTELGRSGARAGYTRVGPTAARKSLAVCQLRVNPAEGEAKVRALWTSRPRASNVDQSEVEAAGAGR